MPAKTTRRYRGYTFDIYAPANQWDRWRVVIWARGNEPPITMPGHATEDEAVNEARTAVDHILDGGSQPKM